MRALRATAPRKRFIRFVLLNMILPFIAVLAMTRIWPMPGYDWLWLCLTGTAVFTLNGLFWGWAFYLSDGDGLRR